MCCDTFIWWADVEQIFTIFRLSFRRPLMQPPTFTTNSTFQNPALNVLWKMSVQQERSIDVSLFSFWFVFLHNLANSRFTLHVPARILDILCQLLDLLYPSFEASRRIDRAGEQALVTPLSRNFSGPLFCFTTWYDYFCNLLRYPKIPVSCPIKPSKDIVTDNMLQKFIFFNSWTTP